MAFICVCPMHAKATLHAGLFGDCVQVELLCISFLIIIFYLLPPATESTAIKYKKITMHHVSSQTS